MPPWGRGQMRLLAAWIATTCREGRGAERQSARGAIWTSCDSCLDFNSRVSQQEPRTRHAARATISTHGDGHGHAVRPRKKGGIWVRFSQGSRRRRRAAVVEERRTRRTSFLYQVIALLESAALVFLCDRGGKLSSLPNAPASWKACRHVADLSAFKHCRIALGSGEPSFRSAAGCPGRRLRPEREIARRRG